MICCEKLQLETEERSVMASRVEIGTSAEQHSKPQLHQRAAVDCILIWSG
jgi:hypothetical protein